MSCWDDIDASNYVEYKSSPASAWAACGFCETCVNYLLKIQWELYTGALAKTTCKAEQRRLLKAGPPMNLKDVKALPCPDEAEAHLLWFMGDGQEHSAKLTGSLEGEVRKRTMWFCGSAYPAVFCRPPDDDLHPSLILLTSHFARFAGTRKFLE
jgi:hypothetical protein